MARARAQQDRSSDRHDAQEAELPPGATDFEPEEYESAAHAREAYHASENGERGVRNPATTSRTASARSRPAEEPTTGSTPPPSSARNGPPTRKTRSASRTTRRARTASSCSRARARAHGSSASRTTRIWTRARTARKYGKENPHPVLKMLKDEGLPMGIRRRDDKGGWGKRFSGDAYMQDHMDARAVLAEGRRHDRPQDGSRRIPD